MPDPFTRGGTYNELYGRIFNFHRDNANPSTDFDWENIVEQMEKFKTPFEINLAVAVVSEIEQEYHVKRYGEKFQSELLKLQQKYCYDVWKLIEGKYQGGNNMNETKKIKR